MLGFLDLKIILLIAHIFGAVIGAGGAFTSDAMFFASVKDRKLTKIELAFMKLGSRMVWLGVVILVISGSIMFLLNSDQYLASSKFLAKVTIVAIVILNGIIFHLSHLPRFHRHAGHHLPSSDEFVRKSKLVMVSGALSVTSWSWTLILGMLQAVPYSYSVIMCVYALTIAGASVMALIIRKRLLGMHY